MGFSPESQTSTKTEGLVMSYAKLNNILPQTHLPVTNMLKQAYRLQQCLRSNLRMDVNKVHIDYPLYVKNVKPKDVTLTEKYCAKTMVQ